MFSGVGGFDMGLEAAGIETVLQAENDPWCLGVLEHHWPDTRRANDVRGVGLGPCEHHEQGEPHNAASGLADIARAGDVGLVYGGFPCTDLSVAGKRAGLSGEQSGLWHEFRRVLQELRPAWCVIENVPGLLSSNRGLDFAVLLHGLEQLGYGWSYRVLDAQHFGVAQRRRRVFVVGSLGGPARAEAVLAECQGCGGNLEAGQDSGEDLAGTLGGGAAGARGWYNGIDTNGAYVTTGSLSAGTLRAGGVNGGNNPAGGYLADVAAALASSLRAHHARHDLDMDTYIPAVMGALDTHLGDKQWLEDQSVEKFGVMQAAGAGVRRLTPLECERLMGWPEHEQSLTIRVCSTERQKNLALAEIRSLRSHSHAGHVARSGLSVSALSAASDSPASSPTSGTLAEVHVAISCEGSGIVLTASRLGHPIVSLFVSNADSTSLFARLGQAVDSARLGAVMTSTLGNVILNGREELLQSETCSMVLLNGELCGVVSGPEINASVADVGRCISEATAVMKSTTSRPGRNSPNYASTLTTLCCFAVAAISPLIPPEIQSAVSYDLRLTLSSGWTRWAVKAGKTVEVPDSHRYRMCGNGVVGNVAEWIGRRLMAVAS
jgi:site-specific DNA-cytosine methylase